MKLLTLLALCSTVVLFPTSVLAQNSLQKEMQMMRDGEKQTAFIEKVAQQAKDKDLLSILAEIDSSILKESGQENISEYFQKAIFPFFENYVKLHNYKQITNAVLPNGRSGLWHYTYITTTTEEMSPFRIAIIDTTEGPKILNISVGECIKGRHPICK
ncbi:MAG TPA: hypothetical protein PLW86_04840 [Rhodocyclaceae bacterium]|nr:hypothetical protein [Rhodocyclaceae bacterium]